MFHLPRFALIMLLAGGAAAYDLGPTAPVKDSTSINMDGAMGTRVGGDNMVTAVPIFALPYQDTGATGGHTNDFDVACPYTGSLSPDVWYSYTPASDLAINVDLFGSAYDTKVYILDGAYNVIACNDDFYEDFTSLIEEAFLTEGITYYIVIDGYGSAFGSYVLNFGTYCCPPPPCDLICSGVAEGEPDNGPEYLDDFNSGCNGASVNFQPLQADQNGDLTFCGVSGWNGSGTRDTDWFLVTFGGSGTITWTVEAEQESYFFELSPRDCATVAVAQMLHVASCSPDVMTLTGDPGSVGWIWAGPPTFDPPVGFEGYNYNYTMNLSGLAPGVIATESTSFDAVKSRYR